MHSENPQTQLEIQKLSPARKKLFEFVQNFISPKKQIQLLQAFFSQDSSQLSQTIISTLTQELSEEEIDNLFVLMEAVDEENTSQDEKKTPKSAQVQQIQEVTFEDFQRFKKLDL